uniref:Putative divalent cation transporter n=1 Tax=Xenopsylla cheopis TaxID=163159 RepID=A0A6M2DYY1_XENCH
MKRKRDIINMIIGNVALVQVQAIVASLIVAVFAMTVGSLMRGEFKKEHALMLCTSSVITATTSCFVLDFVLIGVILLSRQFHMNPDNVATPLAASIGDVVSISVLSAVSAWLFQYHDTDRWLLGLALSIYMLLLIFWVSIVLRNKYTRPVLFSGWVPVISALFISGLGGLVLGTAVDQFDGFVLFQPIINGIGGNLVSVQASRISTFLHQSSILGIVPPHAKICEVPWRALYKGVPYAKMARILVLLSIIGQTVFIFAADFIQSSTITLSGWFVLAYLVVSTLQLLILLYVAHIIIHLMWKFKIDPDNSAIPYLTALGDLSGSILLMIAFIFLQLIGKPYIEHEVHIALLPASNN